MHAVMKQAIVPATSARTATLARSVFRDGANGLKPPIWIPIEPMLAKPHNAYVAIISERICFGSSVKSKQNCRVRKCYLEGWCGVLTMLCIRIGYDWDSVNRKSKMNAFQMFQEYSAWERYKSNINRQLELITQNSSNMQHHTVKIMIRKCVHAHIGNPWRVRKWR